MSKPREQPADGRAGWCVAAATAGLLLLSAASPAIAQPRVYVEGIADGEVWATDDPATPLTRNEGDPQPFGRLRLWVAADATSRLSFFVLGGVAGEGGHESETHGEVEQALVRYTIPARHRLSIEAGKLPMPAVAFAARELSTVNPLIGEPIGYRISHPRAITARGAVSRFDYMVALMDQPVVPAKVVRRPGRVVRAAVGAGATLMTGLRLGGYYTAGPYLDREATQRMPGEPTWKDFGQEVAGLNVQFSRGYLELHGEIARSRYEVPTVASRASGRASYVDARYTWTPRSYTALRVESNAYPYLDSGYSWMWRVWELEVRDLEAGFGYRFGPGTVLKATYRYQAWEIPPGLPYIETTGRAFAAQLSHKFDVRSWVAQSR